MTPALPLYGKVALVTGASRGIGAAIAKLLASDGASVVVNYVSNEGKANEVVNAIVAEGKGKAVALRADISSVVEGQRPGVRRPRHPRSQRGVQEAWQAW